MFKVDPETGREWQSDYARRWVAEGEERAKAKSQARAVLKVLTVRGIAVPDEARNRINKCINLDLLDEWLIRVMTAEKIDDVFGLTSPVRPGPVRLISSALYDACAARLNRRIGGKSSR